MAIQLNQLKSGRFKAPVTILFAKDEVDENGNTKFDKLVFVGVFERVSDARREAFQDGIKTLRKQADAEQISWEEAMKGIEALTTEYVTDYFMGFEKHPKHPFPFLDDNDQPLTSNAENIEYMLSYSEVQLAVGEAFASVNEKQVQTLLRGNYPKSRRP